MLSLILFGFRAVFFVIKGFAQGFVLLYLYIIWVYFKINLGLGHQ